MGIDKDKSRLTAAAEMRLHAKGHLQMIAADQHPPRTEEAMQRLVHELEVHRIELEMQNAELRQARDELEQRVKERTEKLSKTVNVLQKEIAERAKVELALQESEAKYRALFEDAGDYILVLAPATSGSERSIIIDVNHAACNHHGYSREELLWKPITILEEPSYREKPLSDVRLEKPGDFCMFETVHVRKNGSTFPVEASLRMIQIGNNPPVILAIERDISKRKRAEEDLQEANQFSKQVISSVQEGIIVFDVDLNFRVWNPFMEQISGMAAGEVLGRHPLELFPFVQELGLITRLEKVLSGETPTGIDFPYSVPRTGKSGWISALSAPLLNMKGETIGIIATVREISLRKQLDDELQQAMEAAQSANSTMSRLLRTVAHEFRTPLGLLAGSTDILDRYWDRLTPEKRLEQNEHIRSAALQMSNLINSVIAFNQMGTDGSCISPQLLDIEVVCRIVAAEVETVWGSGHVFDMTIAADCAAALLDETLFRRILENLLTNAFRYTPSDGTVTLHVHRDKSRLLLEIIDTGIGIPEEDQKLIFDAFYRSRNVEGRRGLGLGLSIVNESLSQMGGAITMTSRIGEGTTMRVEIPVDDLA